MSAPVVELRIRDDADASVMTTYVPKHELMGTGAPGSTRDDAAGWAKGSVWIDATNRIAYTCVDNATGAAVWVEQGGTGTSSSTSEEEAYMFSWMGF